MKQTIDQILKDNTVMVVDGSMSSALEALGCNLSNKLWTATVLIENPELVKEVHKYYFRAGANCGITCSYQASIPGLMAVGYSEKEAEDYIRLSVKLFLEARDEWWEEEGKKANCTYPICLASVGPYGAYLADGSEYKGHYHVSDEQLYHFHKRRMELLLEAGAEVLLCETDPSLPEALIEAKICEELNADFIISFSCRDGLHTYEGQSIITCAESLKDFPHLKMIGINCTYPTYIESLITALKSATDLPIIVYPNSGEVYDPKTKTWSKGKEDVSFEDYAYLWFKCGAKAVGGCCTTVDKHIKQVVLAKNRYLQDLSIKKISL